MAIKDPAELAPRYADKQELLRIVDEVFARNGIKIDPTVTAEQVQQMMRRLGIGPQDRLFTRELHRMRYGDDEAD